MADEIKIQPRTQQVYRLDEILKGMELPDSPFLTIRHEGKSGSIQDSHITNEQLLSVPGIGGTWWRYSHTTNEDCPIFYWHSKNEYPFTLFVDVEDDESNEKALWITPKGFPRKQ